MRRPRPTRVFEPRARGEVGGEGEGMKLNGPRP